MEIRLLETAKVDLRGGWKFYEKNAAGLGDFFLDCIQADVRSLKAFGGIHETSEGFHRMDGGNVILDFVDLDGPEGAADLSLAKRYLYGSAVDLILAQEIVTESLGDDARVLWPLGDQLQTTRDVVDQTVYDRQVLTINISEFGSRCRRIVVHASAAGWGPFSIRREVL